MLFFVLAAQCDSDKSAILTIYKLRIKSTLRTSRKYFYVIYNNCYAKKHCKQSYPTECTIIYWKMLTYICASFSVLQPKSVLEQISPYRKKIFVLALDFQSWLFVISVLKLFSFFLSSWLGFPLNYSQMTSHR